MKKYANKSVYVFYIFIELIWEIVNNENIPNNLISTNTTNIAN